MARSKLTTAAPIEYFGSAKFLASVILFFLMPYFIAYVRMVEDDIVKNINAKTFQCSLKNSKISGDTTFNLAMVDWSVNQRVYNNLIRRVTVL